MEPQLLFERAEVEEWCGWRLTTRQLQALGTFDSSIKFPAIHQNPPKNQIANQPTLRLTSVQETRGWSPKIVSASSTIVLITTFFRASSKWRSGCESTPSNSDSEVELNTFRVVGLLGFGVLGFRVLGVPALILMSISPSKGL